MIEDIMREYLACAEAASAVDYSDKKSVRHYNVMSDRMRSLVDEVVALGSDAVLAFASLLDKNPAATWAAHHLVEKAELDPATLSRCFTRVEQAIHEAKVSGKNAEAMGQEMWLKEWRSRKP